MATMDIPGKICPHCGGIRWVTFNKTKTLASGDKKTYINYKCAKKNIETGDKWRKNHIEHYRKTAREYVKSRRKVDFEFAEKEREKKRIYGKVHKQERQLYRKKWVIANIEKERAYARKSASRNCKTMSDYYLGNSLSQYINVKREHLTDDMLTKYKTYLTALRQLKQLNNEEIKN